MIGAGAINNNPTFNWIKTLERGTIFAYSANETPPEGALICNGAEISRTTYKLLFDIIGTTYGEGDGSTTFNLPDLTDRVLQGSTIAGTILNAGLPNITGAANVARGSGYTYKAEGAFYDSNNGAGGNWDTSASCRLNIDASRSSSIYGSSDTVQPPALTTQFYIKY